jgi:uncharacterized membrane protein
MDYTVYELAFFFFVYAFIGWCTEVAAMAIIRGKFCNRGILNLPFSLPYGFVMTLILPVMETLKGEYVWQAVAYLVITSVCFYIAGDISSRMTGTNLWDYQAVSLFNPRWNYKILFSVLLSLYFAGLKVFAHPFVYMLSQILSFGALKLIVWSLTGLMILDFCFIIFSARKRPLNGAAESFEKNLQERKYNIGNRISGIVWRRLRKAYPNMTDISEITEEKQTTYTFAKGLCLYKLVWVFFITAFAGDLIETVFIRLTKGVWMSRSSVLYGPFSVVWGIGATLLTALLYRLADRNDRYIFVWGVLIGGTYEYMASLILEIVLGTRFWDYSALPFNLHGRINLLYCMFWGVLALVWIKICYPILSRWIEQIPPLLGVILTWIFVILMVCDLAISGLAVDRYVERQAGIAAHNSVEMFWDRQYPDSFVEFVWPNLIIPK